MSMCHPLDREVEQVRRVPLGTTEGGKVYRLVKLDDGDDGDTGCCPRVLDLMSNRRLLQIF